MYYLSFNLHVATPGGKVTTVYPYTFYWLTRAAPVSANICPLCSMTLSCVDNRIDNSDFRVVTFTQASNPVLYC